MKRYLPVNRAPSIKIWAIAGFIHNTGTAVPSVFAQFLVLNSLAKLLCLHWIQPERTDCVWLQRGSLDEWRGSNA